MKKTYILFVLALAFASCERNTEDQGPLLSDLFGDFQLLEPFVASSNTVDFSNTGTLNFTARFSKTVDWEIHIVGQTSGAENIISGLSNSIDESNSTWDGTTTNLPMFKTEDCLVYLAINAVDTVLSDTLPNLITVNAVRTVDGFVVTDFENGLNTGFSTFIQSGANMTFDVVNDPSGAQGNTFYETSGEVTFIEDLGNIAMPKSAFTDSNFTLSNNPEIVYFNLFARKAPDISSEILVFQFMEDENGNGTFEPNSEDLYEYVQVGLPTDWEQLSIKYDDLTPTAANGNGIKEPDKLIQILYIPVSGTRSPFSAFIDYLIFTENAPLVP